MYVCGGMAVFQVMLLQACYRLRLYRRGFHVRDLVRVSCVCM